MKIIFEEYCIESKIFAIGFDNATNNTAAVPQLIQLCQPYFGGRFFHQRCACHVLNICVQHGLQTLHEWITPIRDALYYLWKHPNIMKQWARYCKANGKHPIRFSRDVPTRWNSTYKLLCESYEYRKLLVRFMQHNVNTINLYEHHWDVCTKICMFLKVFHDATHSLSGIYYPTTHLFLFDALNIVGALNECAQINELVPCVYAMREKWINYYRDIPVIYTIASVFDPRNKFNSLYEFFTLYYQSLGIMDIDVSGLYNNVRNLFYSMYDKYRSVYGLSLNIIVQQLEPSGSGSTSHLRFPFTLRKLGASVFTKKVRMSGSSSSSTYVSEVDVYINTSFEFLDTPDFNVLQWWREHETNFPILAIIAKQIFGTPVSIVTVEQEFSAGGNVLDERRALLSPDSIQIQVCVDDWTKATYQQQELDLVSDENDFFDTNEDTTATEGTSDD
ncbi:hypothetical protein ACOSQ4_012856 [Xanthoceras sorbifolium]